jgi:hypothetical protein
MKKIKEDLLIIEIEYKNRKVIFPMPKSIFLEEVIGNKDIIRSVLLQMARKLFNPPIKQR